MSDEVKIEEPTGPENNDKKPWLSKTLWFNLVVAGAAFIPGAQDWLHGNEEIVLLAFSGVNMILRLLTKGSITLGG